MRTKRITPETIRLAKQKIDEINDSKLCTESLLETIYEEQNLDNVTKKSWDLSDIIGWVLLIQGIVMMNISIIWSLNGDSDKWFSILSIGLICIGFSGVIFRLRK